MRIILFVVTLALLFPHQVLAWGGAGHMVIAAEAYQNLPPQTQAEVFMVLPAHPDFEKWKKSCQPNAIFDLSAYAGERLA